jgi:glycosyltransferase involved in cell wall biosynthesis
MRVAFIGQKGLPTITGGVERYVEDLTKQLVEAGHEVFAYTRPHYTDPKLTSYNGVNLISLPSINTKHLDAISHTLLASIHATTQNFDVIHYQSIGPALVCWLPKLLNRQVKIVATLQSRDYEHQKWGALAQWSLKLGEYLMCLFADEIVVVTEAMVRYVKEKYNRTASYIPNGANLYEPTGADLIAEWNLSPDSYIVAISRLVRHKGLSYLVKAFKNLPTDKKLVIVGDSSYSDDYAEELRALAASDDRIIFTGNQTGETLAQFYANAYLFVQPSESEGLSLALLEAMARRRAVLVSDITENLSAVGNTGFVFATTNVADLQAKLEYILANPEMARAKGEEARTRIEQNFNWAVIGREMAKLYAETDRKAWIAASALEAR